MTIQELMDTEKFKQIAQKENFCVDLLDLFESILGQDDAETLDAWEVNDRLDYDGSLHELIDGKIDIYYYPIRQWAVDNWEWVEEAIEEGLCEGETDYHKLIQGGQYLYYRNQMNQEVEEVTQAINDIIQEMEEAAA